MLSPVLGVSKVEMHDLDSYALKKENIYVVMFHNG